MIGHEVLADGNSLSVKDGKGSAAFSLDGPASNVVVEVLSPSGQLVDTLQLGALGAGTHNIDWDASGYVGGTPTFNVLAKQGSTSVGATPLIRDKIASVGLDSSGGMALTLQSGTSIKYDTLKSIL